MFSKITISATTADKFCVEFELEPETKLNKAIEALKKWGLKPTNETMAAASKTAGTVRFPAMHMAALVNDGKAYWKVKGGRYTKFGVTIWPEVLKASGFDPNQMNPLEVYDLAGHTAVCSTNDEGKANKVIRLEAPS